MKNSALWYTLGCLVTASVATSDITSSPVSKANVTVAMVRAPPPNWPMPIFNFNWTGTELNISETVDIGVRYMKEAASQGADIVTFPELWFPGFPKGKDENNWTVHSLPMYINNSLTVGDANWNRLIHGIRDASVYAQLAFAERKGDNVFMSQALVSPLGDILIHRHKLRPSGSERRIFSDGTPDGLQVVTTALGRVGLLECGEHIYPTMTFPMQAQKENIHFAPFPYMSDANDTRALWWENQIAEQATVRVYAIQAGAFTFMNAVGFSAAYDPLGWTIAEITANTDMEEHPMLFATIPTSGFNTSQTYDVDGQASWGAARQILDNLPGYVPHVEGNLVPQREQSVAYLLSRNLTSEEMLIPSK